MGYAIPKSFHSIRRDIRFPTDFKAMLNWGENFASVEVADIADNGVRLIGLYLPDVGTAVRIGAKGLDEKGRVTWRTRHSCGLMLARRVNALAVVRANCFPPRESESLKRAATGMTDTLPFETPDEGLADDGGPQGLWRDEQSDEPSSPDRRRGH